MTGEPTTLKQAAWAALSLVFTTASFVSAVPYVRSEEIGVIWPSTMKVLFAAAFMLIGLAALRRAGWLQWANYVLLAAFFAAYVLGLRSVLNVAGVTGIA